ncbi:hypothetical protein C8R46DRAFT_1094149 [Mycena filopes]|nr:hypothetical protein C8R46DRAFT_1094149 [Mycena filopes]
MSVNANLRTRIAEADTSIAGLNREIDAAIGGLKLRLKGVQDVRRRLQFELDAIVYRVENLPHELTAEIFLQCLPSPSELSHPHKHHPTKSTAPLVFLEVCRAWRNVALATPRLWADLQLDLDEFPEGTDEDELEVLAVEWFGRAGTCPLSFRVRGFAGMEGFGSDAISTILRNRAPQLQSICLQLEEPHFEAMKDIGPFPILEKLAIALPFPEEDAEGFWYLEIFTDAPRLWQLSFSEGATPSLFLPSYEALSKISCDSLTGDDFLSFVESAPCFTEFKGFVSQESLVIHSEILTQNRFHTLHLKPNSSLHFLRLLRLPALQNFHVSTDIDENVDNNRDFLSFLAHSCASLRCFSTTGKLAMLSADWFTTVMPNVTTLEVAQESRGFSSLTFRDSESPVFMTPTMLSALSSRAIAGEDTSILGSFQQIWPKGVYYSFDDSTAAGYRALVKQGMSVHVGTERRNRV